MAVFFFEIDVFFGESRYSFRNLLVRKVSACAECSSLSRSSFNMRKIFDERFKEGCTSEEASVPSVFLGAPATAAVFAGFGALTAVPTPPPQSVAFYAPDFQLSSPEPWFVPERYESIVATPRGPVAPLTSGTSFIPLQRNVVEGEVEALLALLRSGELRKIVPVWFERSEWVPHESERGALYRNVLYHRGDQSPYGFFGTNGGMIGLTPEVLFHVDSAGVIGTMALAGTHPVQGRLTAADLLSDEKERREHRLVVEFIEGALRDLGDVAIGETMVRELPRLRHLYTPITVSPRRPPQFEELVRRLHPTPALGAVPRESGLRRLFEREGVIPRGRHGAPFGVVFPSGEMLCVVAIRNLQWDQSGSMIGAGCGIVAGSDPAREFKEATAKISSVRTILGLKG
jgi:anthranilate/para-aminobenzoate synthase component I